MIYIGIQLMVDNIHKQAYLVHVYMNNQSRYIFIYIQNYLPYSFYAKMYSGL